MSKSISENVYWMVDKNWFTLSEDKEKFIIKDDAPERAKKSFAMWKKKHHDLAM